MVGGLLEDLRDGNRGKLATVDSTERGAGSMLGHPLDTRVGQTSSFRECLKWTKGSLYTKQDS